jgi:hypothetical protein
MGVVPAQFATCYKCDKQDKKGNLQRCLGWQLLKRLEDDAVAFNNINSEAAAKEDARAAGQAPAGLGDAVQSGGQPEPQQP